MGDLWFLAIPMGLVTVIVAIILTSIFKVMPNTTGRPIRRAAAGDYGIADGSSVTAPTDLTTYPGADSTSHGVSSGSDTSGSGGGSSGGGDGGDGGGGD